MLPSKSTVLEIDFLRTFVAICETGSFTAASKRIARTPSAVSMQMKRLEETLGRPLFEKSGRSVTVTRHGEVLLGYGRQILQLNQETIARFRVSPLEGHISFGAPDDFGIRFLPNILCRFSDTHPDVSVDVVLGPSLELVEKLHQGKLDLAMITTGADDQWARIERVIHTEPLIWFGLRGGIAKLRSPLPLALSGQGCAWRTTALSALDRAGIAYRVSYTSENCQGQMAALLADLAIAPLPLSLAGPELERLGAKDDLPDLGVYQIKLIENSTTSELAKVLARHVIESFDDLNCPVNA